jgi:hypothetical protein
MGLYWMRHTLLVHVARAKCSADYMEAVEKYTPNGLFSWMRQSTQEMGIAREVDHAWTKQWCFGPALGQEATRLARVGYNEEQSELLTARTTIKRKPVPNIMYGDIPLH